MRALIVAIVSFSFVVACHHEAPKRVHHGGATTRRPTGNQLEGLGTWYGKELEGSNTASGERYRGKKLTAAHRTLPLGTRVRVTNKKNGKTVEVRINDRGPYGRAIIDLSYAAARQLDMVEAGVVPVKIEVLE